MARSAGSVTVNFTAGTAKFLRDVELADGSVKTFGKNSAAALAGARTEMVATSAGFKLLEGNITGSSRAAARMLVDIMGMGKAMQALFPVIGAVAFLGVLYKIGEGMIKFFRDMEEAPKKIHFAFQEATASIRIADDELKVANDRLENDIAKLEGKRQNNLKLALDEAALSADKLAASLERDLQAIYKILHETEPGTMKQIGSFLGDFTKSVLSMDPLKMMMSTGKALAGGDPLSVYVGGLTGGGGMVGKIAEAEAKQAKATEAIREKPGLKDKERLDQEKVVIQTMYKEIQAVYEKGVKDVTATLKDANDTALKERLGGAKANFEKQVAFYKDQIRNTSLAETKSELDLARQNALQDRPFENRMALLNAELAKAQGKLGAVGQGQEMQDLAKATGLWGIAIVEVNKQIGALKPKLTETQEAQIKLVYTDLVAVESEEKWRAHVQASTVASNDRIASLKLLSDSIGQGYEATKKFNVETGVMTFIQEHAADATFLLTHQKDIAAERTRLGIEFELKFGAQIKETTDKLKDQIAVDKAVTDVINQGSYAMRNAALEAEIRRMEEHKLTDEQKQQIIVMRQKFAAQEAMATGEEIVKLTRQVQEIDAVTDAIRKGAEAERKAKNEAKYAEMEQAHPGTSDFERTKDSKQHYQDLLRDATRITQEHKNRIETIDQELVVLELERALGADEVETLIQERNLNNERLEQQSKLNLLHGKAIDGLRAFVQEMKATMKTPAQIMYESMVDAMGKLADEFTKLITHQKVSFKKMFQDLGASVVRNLIMEGLKHAITIIFPKLAGAQKGSDTDPMVTRPKTGQPDGTPQSPFCVIVMDTPAAPVGGNTPPAPDKVRAGLAGLLGSIGAVLLGSIKLPAKGGGKAEGGEVSPGSAYVVGERGPEPFFPKVSGQVMSNAMAQKTFGGGGGHTYFMSIDARGTDPVLTEQRVYRAIREAHRDAIGSSVQATVLRTARVPAGK